MDELLSVQTFKLKGRLYTLTVLHLLNTDLTLFAEQLAEAVQRAPRWFNQTPVILDCTALLDMPLALDLFCQTMRDFGLYPIAIQHASSTIQTLAQSLGLPILHGSADHDKPLFDEKPAVLQEPPNKTRLHTTPIRSGQQIVSKEGDLIVISPVSHGAELLADGHIHVYGPLRGRALAGMTGDKEARIFCQALEAELVAIAGIYCLSDAMQKVNGPCQIFLQDDRIQIEPL